MPTSNGPHCFVILTDPNKTTKDVLLVPFCSVKDGIPHDGSCILVPGDHDFIKQRTWVAYRFLAIESARAIEAGIKSKEFSAHKPCSTEIHAHICKGLLDSPFTALKFKKYYENSLGEPDPSDGEKKKKKV